MLLPISLVLLSGSQKVTHYGGTTTIINSVHGHSYTIFPEMDEMVCHNTTSCVGIVSPARPTWFPLVDRRRIVLQRRHAFNSIFSWGSRASEKTKRQILA